MAFADMFLPEFDNEMKTTRSLLERVPFNNPAWKPHTKSTSLGGLATHLANLAGFGVMIANDNGRDFAKVNPETMGKEHTSTESLLAAFDANSAASRKALAAMPDSKLGDPWTLQNGSHVIFTLPRGAVIRTLLMNHIIHHRGQLSVYLRLNDVPLPSIYGPTADTGF